MIILFTEPYSGNLFGSYILPEFGLFLGTVLFIIVG